MLKPRGIDYAQYLASPEWQEKRAKRLALDKYKCALCPSKNNLNVHHLTYANLGNEDVDNDLITLCRRCHQKLEDYKKVRDEHPSYFYQTLNTLVDDFIKTHEHTDIAFGGNENLCKPETIKELLFPYLKQRGILDNHPAGTNKVQAHFRDAHYVWIEYILNKNPNISAWEIHIRTSLNYNFIQKYLKNRKELKTMIKPNNFDNVKAAGEFEKINLGGHYMTIKGVKEQKNKNGGDMIVVAFDFDMRDKQEGYFKSQFMDDVRSDKKWPYAGTQYVNVLDQKGNCSKSFKTFCTCVESSNPGFTIDWDAKDFGKQFTGKSIGGVFGEVENEYNGKTSMRVQLRWFVTYKDAGNAKIPEARLLPPSAPAAAPAAPIPPEDDDLPF